MIRCAIYIRVSTEEQAIHGLSIDTQKQELTDYARNNNYEIVDYYIDEGKTARKSIAKRFELQRMLNDVRSRKIDLIIFTKLDRWFRNISDYYKVQDVLEENHVNWKTIKENYDTSTSNGRLHINIMLSVAQDEADRTSERIKAVMQNKLRNKEATSGSLPIGYKLKDKKIIIDDEKSCIAKDVFELYYIHNSQHQVFKGILEKYNISLCDKTIRRMLCNKIYIGIYRGISNFNEPLIDETKFNEIQQTLKTRNIKPTKTGRTFIFTGLVICSECNHSMAANAQIRTYGPKEYIHYKCNQYYNRKLCNHKKVVYENKIEEYLLNNIENEILKFKTSFKSSEEKKQDYSNSNKKASARKKLNKLKELYINDLIDIDMYKKDYEKYTSILNFEDIIEEQKDMSRIDDFLKMDYKALYKTLTNEEKRMLWRSILKEIKVDKDNNIALVFA